MMLKLGCYDFVKSNTHSVGITTVKLGIKSKLGYEDTPVIAVTAYAMKGDRERFLAEGFNEYIPKPVDVVEFKNILNKYRKEREKSGEHANKTKVRF